jgi:arylsulfatase
VGFPSARFRWRLALGVLAAAALSCSSAPKPKQRWNVVVILVDTLRADRLDLYGYSRPTSPHLRELAKTGVVLRGARSQAGCTFPSANSILTSRWPQLFLAGQDKNGMGIPPGIPSLAELLHGQGYATAAVSSSLIVRATPSSINHEGGFGRGFETFDEGCPLRAAPCVNERAEDLLPKLHEPFFLYLHYIDPHEPYQPPKWHERRFALDPSEKRWVRHGDAARIRRALYDHDKASTFDADDVRHLSDLYDEEIVFLDEQLDLLFGRLRSGGLLNHTVVVFLSDHGEELLDHNNFGHCRDMAYETLLRTPFVFWIPNQTPGTRQQLALNLDLVPTVLDLLHLPYDAHAFAGRSLRPMIEDNRAVHDVAFAAQGASRVASDGRYKVWLNLTDGSVQAFDLAAGETVPLRGEGPPEVKRLRAALLRWLADNEGGSQADGLRRAREIEAKLKALGYL